jgi:hypothetical protein
MSAVLPVVKRNGATGMNAPAAKEKKDDVAAPDGEPSSSGFRPSLPRARRSSARSLSASLRVASAAASSGSTPSPSYSCASSCAVSAG